MSKNKNMNSKKEMWIHKIYYISFLYLIYFLFIRKVMLTFLINKIHCTQIYCINLAHEQIY